MGFNTYLFENTDSFENCSQSLLNSPPTSPENFKRFNENVREILKEF